MDPNMTEKINQSLRSLAVETHNKNAPVTEESDGTLDKLRSFLEPYFQPSLESNDIDRAIQDPNGAYVVFFKHQNAYFVLNRTGVSISVSIISKDTDDNKTLVELNDDRTTSPPAEIYSKSLEYANPEQILSECLPLIIQEVRARERGGLRGGRKRRKTAAKRTRKRVSKRKRKRSYFLHTFL
jgi:hypothetical protein